MSTPALCRMHISIFAKIRHNTQKETDRKDGQPMFQLKWIFDTVDKKYKPWLYLGLSLSVITSIMMLINPIFSARLVDEVIIAQNPKPLLGILA
ncbi:MAG: hypothetical protein J6S59_06650, partial [Clostridia bacterium]|nr:hypothetical protein [Clostridia bacterium]